jgi:hypothetical protein
MQPLQPLGIADVGLTAGNMLGISRIDQNDFEAALIEELKRWDPIDPSRLHRDGSHAALLEPIGQTLQISGEGSKAANWLVGILVWIDCRDMHGGADIDRCGAWVGWRDILTWTGSLCLSHDILLMGLWRGWTALKVQFPNRDRRGGVTTLKCATAHGPRFLTG